MEDDEGSPGSRFSYVASATRSRDLLLHTERLHSQRSTTQREDPSDKTVTLSTVVDNTLQTFMGGVPISGNGDWAGTVNGTALTGTIANVSGTVRACLFFFCGQADYVGHGTWTGTLTGSHGTGHFKGVITFTRSSLPQIPINQPIPISGSWNSSFLR